MTLMAEEFVEKLDCAVFQTNVSESVTVSFEYWFEFYTYFNQFVYFTLSLHIFSVDQYFKKKS